MSYRPDENDFMAYLYGELEGEEKEKLEQYLQANPAARKQMEQFQDVRTMLNTVKDKEVIAPPIFVEDRKQRWLWSTPYIKTIISIAASLLVIMLFGKFSGASISLTGNEFKLSFGHQKVNTPADVITPSAALTTAQVQQMITQSLNSNNMAMQANWQASQQALDASIRKNLAVNSDKIDALVKASSTASQDQIRQYVSTLQSENMQLVKDYFQLTAGEQKQYIEGLLVDFAKYLQQQRKDDLQLVQMRLNNIEQNTNVFKQETEQILSSIISTVGNTSVKETKY